MSLISDPIYGMSNVLGGKKIFIFGQNFTLLYGTPGVVLCTTTTLNKWKKNIPSQSFEACVFVTEVVPDYK